MKKFVLILIFLFPLFAVAQYEKMLDALEDSEEEIVNGKLVLRFFDAEKGTAVENATIAIEGAGNYTTDLQGRALIDTIPDGKYGFRFEKKGYIPAIYTFEIIAGTIFYNRFSVCPEIEFGVLRVVVEWAKRPDDLDLHLIKQGGYHISFQNAHTSDDGSAQLDRDDRNGFGPETITIKSIDNSATYTCYVKDFTHSNRPGSERLSKSKVVCRIYGNNQLLNTLTISPEQEGTTWNIFEIRNGKIVVINTLGNQY
ncbi:MAG: hypothetical protein M0R21_00795 [Lentimicrobiaceae bacterium]|nr:hypothetical protein [Lentimicrobiaceae bacterium]